MRGPLWKKIATGQTKDEGRKTKDSAGSIRPWSFVLRPFTREERIFTVYGLLALLYSLVAIAFAVVFWRQKLIGTIDSLLTNGGMLGRVVAAALILLVVLPLLAGLLFAGLGLGRAALAWLIRRGYGRQPALLATIAGVLALLLALLASRTSASGATQRLGCYAHAAAAMERGAGRAAGGAAGLPARGRGPDP